jgi:hypothetical protein
MAVGELMAELERAPRRATVRALVVRDDIVAHAVDVNRVQFAATKSIAERVPEDIVIVASVERARVRRRLLPGGCRS